MRTGPGIAAMVLLTCVSCRGAPKIASVTPVEVIESGLRRVRVLIDRLE